MSARRLVLATGARELFLPFPGWTLPGVFGAGGAQALWKSGADLRGRTAIVAGSGPLLLPVAASLTKAGARVVLVAEQASWISLAGFAAGLALAPSKILEAARHRRGFARTPYRTGRWIAKALGTERVEGAVVTDGVVESEIACDLLAVGYGLVPNVELARLLGCAMRGGAVAVDGRQRTSVDGVLCAGEPCGVAGVEVALSEGEIAGIAAAGRSDPAPERRLSRRRASGRRLAARMRSAFRLAAGAPRARLGGHDRVPVRRRRRRRPRRLRGRSRGQALDAGRHGRLPGTRVRPGARVPVRMGFGYGTSAGEARPDRRSRRPRGRLRGRPREVKSPMEWRGVFPAVTTPFREDLSLDLDFLAGHLEAMLAAGCRGFVPLGSLGESATLAFSEKAAVLEACRPRPGAAARRSFPASRRSRPPRRSRRPAWPRKRDATA